MVDPPCRSNDRSDDDPSLSAAPLIRRWQGRRVVAWGRLLVAVVILGMLVVVGRVVQLKTAPDPRLARVVDGAASSLAEPARRGDLLDRRGRIAATTTVGYRLFIDPHEVEDASTVAVDVAGIIGGDPVDIDKRLESARPESRYVVVHPLLESWQVEAVRGANLRGVRLEARSVRQYPYGDLAATLVGTVGTEHTGLSGMELRFNETMQAAPGRLTYLRDVRRRALWIEPVGYQPGVDGDDVRLSIDLVIQELVERRVQQAVEEFDAAGGRAVVLDSRTGELLALYDTLRWRPGAAERTPIEDESNLALRRNRCVSDPYEPGSTFKPFVWSVATALGRAEPEEVLPTPENAPHRTSTGRRIRDSHYNGPQTWRQVLVRSMNSGMAIVAERMTTMEMRSAVRDFGFGQRTACGLPGESRGIVTSAADWTTYSQTSVAMGHEISVTPVQMVRAFSAFSRDGTMIGPRLTAAGRDDEAFRVIRRAVDAETARLTREILREVVTDGTGRRASSTRYALFGKSGTAQLPRIEGGGYHEDRYVSSFIAGAPFEDPRLVVLCVIDDPNRSRGHWGGVVAAPVVKDVMEGALDYLGVAPSGHATE